MRLTMTVSLPQQPSSVGEARRMLAALLSLTSADAQTRDHLAVLISEACANVVQHGDTGATIDVHIAIESDTCVLEVGNRGRVPEGAAFPGSAPDPAQINGRGLPLIAALSDSAQFVATAPGYVLLRMTVRLRAHTRVAAAQPFGP